MSEVQDCMDYAISNEGHCIYCASVSIRMMGCVLWDCGKNPGDIKSPTNKLMYVSL